MIAGGESCERFFVNAS